MTSLSNNAQQNWIDITEDFRNAAQKLKLGELVHDDMFSLYEAMAAIELMDPKMDAGMVCNKNKKPLKFEEMIEKKLIKIDDFTTEELIGIFDDTYSCLVTWLNGHSMAQTIFINVFLHNPNLICDKTLKTFSIAILKIVDMICNFVTQASVFEEEDFQPKTYGFDLVSNVNISKIVPMIKVTEDEIKNMMDKLSVDEVGKIDLYRALLIRIKFTKYFFLSLYTFKKYLYIQNALPLDEFVANFTENLNVCEKALDEWIETIDYGIKPDLNKSLETSKSDYPTIIGFKPLINQRLLAPSFPKHTKIKSRLEMVHYLKEFLKRVRKILKVQQVEKFIDILKFFNDYSMLTPSCVVSRSMLQLFYMPKPNVVFGEIEFVKFVKESCKEFIKPPSLSGKISLENNTKEIVEAFFHRCLLFFKNVIQIHGHNRASQRGKLAVLLKDMVIIHNECATLEQYLSNNSFCDYLQVWILFYNFHLMSQYLLSGFELELYSIHEYPYIFFELDYMWDYISGILKRASEIYLDHDTFLNNSSNAARKKHKSKIRNRSQVHETLMLYYKGMNQMAAALHRILMALYIEQKIEPLTQSLNSEQIRYNHRFLPLLQFEGALQSIPILLSYPKYKERYDMLVNSQSTIIKRLYYESSQFFEQARQFFEAIKDGSFQREVQSYVKVAKTNTVVSKLIFSGHIDQGRIEFNFSETSYFPIIRFVK